MYFPGAIEIASVRLGHKLAPGRSADNRVRRDVAARNHNGTRGLEMSNQ